MSKDIFGEAVKSDYEQFEAKFKPKLTTDDCYTPVEIYEAIKAIVVSDYKIGKDVRILRPFKPNGDYQKEDYSGDCVVIDNPPFSILAEIRRWYMERGIKYFLFAPHLTLFGAKGIGDTNIVASCDIIYQNGANVKTSFVTNLNIVPSVVADPRYRKVVKELQQKENQLPKYEYPDNVITVSRLAKIVERGGNFAIPLSEAHNISALQDQRNVKKGIFGSGYLISELRAEERRKKREVTFWRLSNAEREIIEILGDAKVKDKSSAIQQVTKLDKKQLKLF